MRVNDLSKEIGKTNKEILAFLNENGVEAKSHMSSITDEQAAMVRNKMGAGQAPVKEEQAKETASKEASPKNAPTIVKAAERTDIKTAGADKRKEEPKTEEPKKKRLTAVFRPQNAEQPRPRRQQVNPAQTGRVITPIKKEQPPIQSQPQPKVEEVSPEPVQQPKNIEEIKEEPKKAPLVEGRDSVKKLGNIFADMPVKKTSDKPNTGNRPQNSFNQNRDNRQNRGDNRPNFRRDDSGRPMSRDGQGTGRPVSRDGQGTGRPVSRDGQGTGRPVSRDGQGTGRPVVGGKSAFNRNASGMSQGEGNLNKKNNNQKQQRNNYKDKTDKKHRTEDGPAKGGKMLSKHPFIKPEAAKVEVPEDDIKEIIIPETITIKDLASKMKMQPSVIVKKLFLKGQIVNLNSELSFEDAEEIALEYDIICTMEEKVDVIAELLKEDEERDEDLVARPPVVVVMGHVDHGKTSLLDKIRKTNVTSREAGGITQAIGAYQVEINGREITFLDTPGHEAFTAMRMRGAQSTDIAILVVAADDGVMPQTIEAINHAKAANVEIVVAINKIDKPAANIDKVKQELTEYGLIAEDWGGSTTFCPVSAKTGEGIENLLEMILLTADVKELKANPNRRARGLVIEAQLDKGRGPVATVLVQKGTLRVGDFIAAGACSGKVRAMINDKGEKVKVATPSTPVEILGLDNVPNAGEVFVATDTDKEAKDFAATFISESKNKLIEETKAKMSLDDLFSQIKAGDVKELPLIVKADVQGSVEAVKTSLLKLSNEEVQVKVIHSGVGVISESDVDLAAASNAIIIGFNVKPDPMAKSTADHEKVEIKLYSVIYQAIDDVERALKGMLAPVYEEKIIGHAEIRQIFKASGIGNIAGSYILDGMFQRGCKARITREGKQIFDGSLASLKRFKDDVKEVKAGYECGLVFEGFNDIQEGDQIEGYNMVEVPRG